MDFIHCPQCGQPFARGTASYCAKCGTLLSKSINPAQEIKQLENEPKPYEALRFTAALIIGFGWLVIILGWLVSVTIVYTLAMQYLPANNSTNPLIANVIASAVGIINTIIGIVLIGAGQVFLILLDIRHDMHTTSRLVRRFGLLMSEK